MKKVDVRIHKKKIKIQRGEMENAGKKERSERQKRY